MRDRMRRWAARAAGTAAVAVAAGAVAACGDEAPAATCDTVFGARPEGDGLRSGSPAAEARYRPVVGTDAGFDKLYRPALERARSFHGDDDVRRLRWAAAHSITYQYARLGTSGDGAVLVGGATVEFGTGANGEIKGGRVGALRVSDGKLLWNRAGALGVSGDAGGGVRVALAEGPYGGLRVKDGSKEARSAGLDLRTGRRLWCVSAEDASRMPNRLTPAGPGTAVGIFLADHGSVGALRAIRSRDGGVLWSAAAPKGSQYDELAAGDGIAAVTARPETPREPAGPFEFAAYRMSDGAKLWHKGDSIGLGLPGHTERIPIAVGGGSAVVLETSFGSSAPEGETRVAAYRTTDGGLRWSHPARGAVGREHVKVAGSRVVAVMDGRVKAFDITNGRTLWNRATDHAPKVRDGAVHGDRLYAPQQDRPGLVVLDLKNGATRRTLDFFKEPVYDVTADDGVLMVQYGHLTLAFDLPRR